jgi:hypothetical protein
MSSRNEGGRDDIPGSVFIATGHVLWYNESRLQSRFRGCNLQIDAGEQADGPGVLSSKHALGTSSRACL